MIRRIYTLQYSDIKQSFQCNCSKKSVNHTNQCGHLNLRRLQCFLEFCPKAVKHEDLDLTKHFKIGDINLKKTKNWFDFKLEKEIVLCCYYLTSSTKKVGRLDGIEALKTTAIQDFILNFLTFVHAKRGSLDWY